MDNGREVVDSFEDIEIYQKNAQIAKIASLAMKEEREKNRKLGIASSFMQNGEIYYELPDGTITKTQP